MHQTQHTTSQAIQVMAAVLSAIDHEQRSQLSATEWLQLRTQLKEFRERVSALECTVIAEMDEQQAAMHATGTPLTTLVALDDHVESNVAAAQVLRARQVNRHRRVRKAALAGRVSTSHAQAVSKAIDALPRQLTREQRGRAEELLLDRATTSTPRQVAASADAVVAVVAPELVPDPADAEKRLLAQRKRALEKRYFRHGDDGDGSIWFKGSLPHLEAEVMIKKIEAYVASERRSAREHNDGLRSLKPSLRTLREHRRDSSATTPGQRRADALVRLMEEHHGAPNVSADRPRIVVTMTEESLRRRAVEAGVLSSGAQISAGDLRRLCCDADLMPVVLGSKSQALDVGQEHRLVTSAIRKALSLRDGGCLFPSCSVTDAQCEAHHVIPWWAGGATALENLVLLCRYHHSVVEPNRHDPHPDKWWISFEDGQPLIHPPERAKDRFAGSVDAARADGADPPVDPPSHDGAPPSHSPPPAAQPPPSPPPSPPSTHDREVGHEPLLFTG